ncbi:bifunctional epoxide hydrolase 2-like [Styela clava]|uniref:bifunctional epoxide hydrolase 2-like n=1 Tax=Styela clava TaxID=7725 RepID=UPI00193A3479|nr:bifunctional epoxide hydrolase 2-like [Styela clava]
MKFKAVIFDIGGVLVPQPQIGILNYEKQLKLPIGFLGKVFMDGAPDNSFCKLERGELLFSEFIPKFDADVKAAAKRDRIDVKKFKTENLFSMMMSQKEAIHKDMFHAVKTLKIKNVKTCALTNNWIDDRGENKEMVSKFSVLLRRFFDVVVESSIERLRKPDPELYKLTCERLGVKPNEAVFLDDIGYNLKSAAELGITTIKVTTPKEAIKELEKVTGLDLTSGRTSDVVYPPPCKHDDVPHGTAVLKSGYKIHYVDIGEGPVVMLFHGFPELWYSWRYQIPALASAGYRVIAMDQRGFGDSSSPPEISEYSQKKICQDAIDLMDSLGISQATVVGHDWGGAVVWNLGLFYSHRLNGVCGITTPLFSGEGAKRIQAKPETFDYQMYFQAPGVAEKEFESDIPRTFKIFFRGVKDVPIPFPDGKPFPRDTTNVTKRGGMFVGYPEDVAIGKLINEEDLAYYSQQYKKTGFRGPLNWYRNHKESMGWQMQYANRKVVVPSLMITASHDFVLKPEFSLGMEDRIPDLSRVALENCSHWATVEKHDEVNDAIISWLDKIHKSKAKL